jgi:pimeloyl-ACP methyl ester carboxylesterase
MKELYFNENKIYYRINAFKPERLTLVFVHGVSGSSSAWVEYEKMFGSRYNILTFDLRGHGKSFRPTKYSDYEIWEYSEDLFGLVEHVGIKEFILISHSFATLIAQEFLVKHQDVLLGVVFLSPKMSTANDQLFRLLWGFLGLAKIFELLPYKPRVGSHLDYLKYKNSGDWNVRRNFADVCNTSLMSYLYSIRQMSVFDRDDSLQNIHIPTLIIHGEKDTFVTIENSYKMKSMIKDSEFIMIKNADHIIVLNNFTEVSQVISSFVEKIKNSLKAN